VWMGQQYALQAFPVLVLLATAKVISSGQSMTVARLFGTSQHKFIGILNSIEAVTNLVLSLILVHWYGMVGVAFATLIPCLACNGVVLPIFTLRVFNLSVFTFIRQSIAGPVAAFVAASYIVYLLGVSAASFVQIVIQGIKISAFFLLFALLFCVDRDLLNLLRMKWETKKSQ